MRGPRNRSGSPLAPTASYGEAPFLAVEFASEDGPVTTIRLAEFPPADDDPGPYFAGAVSIGSGRWTVECYPMWPVKPFDR